MTGMLPLKLACQRVLTVLGIVLVICVVSQLPILRQACREDLAVTKPHGELHPARDIITI